MKAKDVKVKPYKNIFVSARSIVKAEGWKGLQKGLTAQSAFQFTLNSVRLGIYQTLDDKGFLNRDENGKISMPRSIVVGAFCGFCGGMASGPFYMIKVQLQSKSANQKYAVGYQHQHTGLANALKTIYTNRGFFGLWKGYTALIPRNVVGSSVQLPTFSACKEWLGQYEVFANSVLLKAVAGSAVTGLLTCIFQTPFDTAATRMFNQPYGTDGKGLLYRNLFDCFFKVVKTEGFLTGLYKGFGPNYFRMAPQHLLNLTFWEKLKEMNKKLQVKS